MHVGGAFLSLSGLWTRNVFGRTMIARISLALRLLTFGTRLCSGPAAGRPYMQRSFHA